MAYTFNGGEIEHLKENPENNLFIYLHFIEYTNHKEFWLRQTSPLALSKSS